MKRKIDDLDAFAYTASSSSSSSSAVPVLDAKQQAVIDAVVNIGESAFITGSAGAGKSFTLRRIVGALRARGDHVSVCSSTGRSAVELQLQGSTLHSFLALGDVGNKSVSYYVKRLRSERYALHYNRIIECTTLVIDEISMVSADDLSKFEGIVAAVRRRHDEIWGGIRVLYSGDFMQLRAVPPRAASGMPSVQPQLAFEALRPWRGANIHVHNLTTLHRQSRDTTYGELLDRVRFGSVTPADIALLRSRIITKAQARALADSAVFLYSRNAEVDSYNTEQLMRLDVTTRHVYTASIRVVCKAGAKRPEREIIADAKKYMTDGMRALPRIELRLHARVLLLANLNVAGGLANGTTGTVTAFDAESGLPIVTFDGIAEPVLVKQRLWPFDNEPEYHGLYEQVPLMLAWATSVHRSQGLTLPRIVADASREACFAAGMAYVIMSRVDSIDNLYFLSFSSAAIYCDRKAKAFYDALCE